MNFPDKLEPLESHTVRAGVGGPVKPQDQIKLRMVTQHLIHKIKRTLIISKRGSIIIWKPIAVKLTNHLWIISRIANAVISSFTSTKHCMRLLRSFSFPLPIKGSQMSCEMGLFRFLDYCFMGIICCFKQSHPCCQPCTTPSLLHQGSQYFSIRAANANFAEVHGR
jgi:hypothetical protein